MGKVVKIIGLYFQSLGKKNLIRRKSFGSNFLFKPTIHLFGHNEFDGFPNVLPCGIRAVMDCTKSQTGKPVSLKNVEDPIQLSPKQFNNHRGNYSGSPVRVSTVLRLGFRIGIRTVSISDFILNCIQFGNLSECVFCVRVRRIFQLRPDSEDLNRIKASRTNRIVPVVERKRRLAQRICLKRFTSQPKGLSVFLSKANPFHGFVPVYDYSQW